MKAFITSVAWVVWKDLRAELRTKELAGSVLIFALLVVLAFSFAFDPTRIDVNAILPGVLWVAVFFAGMFGLHRSIAVERSADSLYGLMLAPADWSAIFFGKMVGNLLLVAALEAVVVPVLLVLFRATVAGPLWQMLLTLVLGSVGFVAVGTFLATLSINARASELLLPLVLFPLLVPVVIGAVESTGAVLAGRPLAEFGLWLRLLAVYDLVFILVPFLLFEYLLEV